MPRLRISLTLAAAPAAVALAGFLPNPGQQALAPPAATVGRSTPAVTTAMTFAAAGTATAARAADVAATGTTGTTVTTSTTGTTGTSGTADATGATGATGGLCSVTGIGGIVGLLGFCDLGVSGLIGELNNVCEPALPEPESAGAGIDSMVAPPASGKQPATLYDEYGVAGNYWAATNLQCSDMTSLIGNDVAGMVFDAAKSIDRVTITVYQTAAGNGIVSWLQRVTDDLITSLGHAIYFPYLSVVVILAAIWLAWQGLIRKRATRTIEGTVWMVGACAAAVFLIGAPAEVTGVGGGLSDGISQALDAAFAKLPSPGPSSCVPVDKNDPQVQPAVYSYTSSRIVVDQNADELWSVLVCKPWLDGEFGTSVYSTGGAKPTVVNTYGRSLLWAQAIAADEKATPALIQAKQAAYAGIASSIQTNDPADYPLFQGNEWTTRLEIAFAALFAALLAGVLILLISVTLILLKLSFLLLLIVGPFFLLIGAHPGAGRIVALRWLEMLIGVLLKQAAVALVLSLLLYCYALIMGTSDAVLPWALKVLMITLVTVAAFIYRKPFQHLFSAAGYGVIGAQELAAVDLGRAAATARAGTVRAVRMFPSAAHRALRPASRDSRQAATLAAAVASGGSTAAAAGLLAAGAVAMGAGAAGSGAAGSGAAGSGAADATEGATATASGNAAGGDTGAQTAFTTRVRAGAATSSATLGEPPPLNLPPRNSGSASPGPARMAPGTAVRSDGAPPSIPAATATAARPGPDREPAVTSPRHDPYPQYPHSQYPHPQYPYPQYPHPQRWTRQRRARPAQGAPSQSGWSGAHWPAPSSPAERSDQRAVPAWLRSARRK